MRHFKESGHCLRHDSVAAGWGDCVRYVEIGDDRYATRQVEFFHRGRVLRYDRTHWCDAYGQLFGCLFSHKQKAVSGSRGAEVIDGREFERAWHAALRSPFWEQQVAHSRTGEWGPAPFWLPTS